MAVTWLSCSSFVGVHCEGSVISFSFTFRFDVAEIFKMREGLGNWYKTFNVRSLHVYGRSRQQVGDHPTFYLLNIV